MDLYSIQYLDVEENKDYDEIIGKVLERCFNIENIIKSKLCVSIVLTTPENIRKYNKQYRDVDKPTDVLSFPMFEKEELEEKMEHCDFQFNDTLGDMIISIPQVEEQAKEYGHSFERELAYMVVHSFYHLMGYDHIKDEDKSIMREKEEFVLKSLNISRS